MHIINTLVKVIGGTTPKGFSSQIPNGSIPFFKVADMNSFGNEKYMTNGKLEFSEKTIKNWRLRLVPKNSVIFPKIGGAIATNKKRIMGCKGAIDANTMALIPSDRLRTDYLYYFMLSLNLSDYSTGSTMPQLSNSTIGQISIPIPSSLKEQKRIAEKIEKVHLLLEKSKTKIKDVEDLINSVCKQEFEKTKNSRDVRKLGDLCNIIKGKFPTMKTPEGKCTFVVTAEKRKSANAFQFNEEAVCIPLVSSTGHGHASMHRIHYEKGKFALANIMVALIPKDKSKILTRYLYYYLSFYKGDLFVSLMRGGANVTIPLYKLSDVRISIPKMKKQEKLVSIITKIEELKQRLLKEQSLFNQLFQSTLDYAFRGKL